MTLAVGIYQPRKRSEVEELRRATKPYGLDFTFQVGGFTAEGLPGIPHRIYRTFDQFVAEHTGLVAIELDTHAVPLGQFAHPEHATYLLGPNTGTIPRDVLDRIGRAVMVETPDHQALNASVAAAIVLHDRYVTLTQEAVA